MDEMNTRAAHNQRVEEVQSGLRAELELLAIGIQFLAAVTWPTPSPPASALSVRRHAIRQRGPDHRRVMPA